MKIIDLLNKIANGEEVPKKIEYRNIKFVYDKDNRLYVVENYNEYNDLLMELSNHKGTDLNYEVEILEEEKKDNFTGWKMYQDGKEVCSMDCSVEEKKIPEKWNDLSFTTMRKKEDSIDDDIHKLKGYIETIMRTQNDVIDYLKRKGE